MARGTISYADLARGTDSMVAKEGWVRKGVELVALSGSVLAAWFGDTRSSISLLGSILFS